MLTKKYRYYIIKGTKREETGSDTNVYNSHRLSIPSQFQKYLEETLVIAKGFEKCLYLYNLSDWKVISDKVNNLSFTKAINRKFARALNSGAYEVEVDLKGRIMISQLIVDYAGLIKSCTIIGVGNRIEIWNSDEYNKYLDDNPNLLETLGEELDI